MENKIPLLITPNEFFNKLGKKYGKENIFLYRDISSIDNLHFYKRFLPPGEKITLFDVSAWENILYKNLQRQKEYSLSFGVDFKNTKIYQTLPWRLKETAESIDSLEGKITKENQNQKNLEIKGYEFPKGTIEIKGLFTDYLLLQQRIKNNWEKEIKELID